MSDAMNKFDVNGIINSIKSMINPEGNTPNPDPDDAVGVKIAQLSTMVQQLAHTHAEQSKELTKVNKILNDLFKDIEALRNLPEQKVKVQQAVEAKVVAKETKADT